MIQNDYDDSLRRSADDMAWVMENVCHIDHALAINVRGALINSFNRLYERHGIRSNTFIISANLIDCLWKAGYITRDFRTDRMLFEGVPVYTTHEPDVMMAAIREEDK